MGSSYSSSPNRLDRGVVHPAATISTPPRGHVHPTPTGKCSSNPNNPHCSSRGNKFDQVQLAAVATESLDRVQLTARDRSGFSNVATAIARVQFVWSTSHTRAYVYERSAQTYFCDSLCMHINTIVMQQSFILLMVHYSILVMFNACLWPFLFFGRPLLNLFANLHLY